MSAAQRGVAREEGSATIVALVALMALAALASGAAVLAGSLGGYLRWSEERAASRQRLARAAREALELLAADPSPEADAPVDPVWSSVDGSRADGLVVDLSDLSSRLNPNWIQKALLARSGIGELLAPGASPDLLQQRREDRGFSTDIESAYGDLFRTGALAAYFTGWSYANVNTTDEFALRALYRIRTGDDRGAEAFHAGVRQALSARRILDRAGLAELLGAALGAVSPIVTSEPEMNAHFVPPLILRELLAHPEWGVPRPGEAAETLLERRERVELTAAELRLIIGAPETSRIHQYLGVTTWFWRVTVSGAAGGERLEVVAARLPDEGDDPPRFVVVEEKYAR